MSQFGPLIAVTGSGLRVVNDTLTTAEDQILSANVLANDVTVTGGTLRVIEFRVRVFGDDTGDTAFNGGQTALIGGVGSLRINENGVLSFTPNANYFGTVPAVTLLITDGIEARVSTLTIVVTPANDAPIASDDARITLVDTPVTFNLLATDTDPDNDALTITAFNGVSRAPNTPFTVTSGTVTHDGAGGVTFTPDALFEGTTTFTYTVSDGTLTDTATVTVIVGVSNHPMVSAVAPISGVRGAAAFNFGLTFRGRYGDAYNNGINVTTPPFTANQGLFFLTNREPWLYDRATTLYKIFLRTQDVTILNEAFALADTYFAGVQVSGSGLGTFNIVGGDNGANPTDVKYLYPIVAEWYEREKTRLGLASPSVHRAAGIALYNQAILSFSRTYNPNSAALWTERAAGYAILACVAGYWLHRRAGNITAANTALSDAWAYFALVESMSVASGAPLHGHNQHEGSAITTPISSPWMAAFLAEALLQLYRTDPADNRIPTWISNYGTWLLDNAFYVTDGSELSELAGLRLPAYLAANTQTPTTFREGELLDAEHAPDLAGLLRKVVWARTLLGQSVVAFNTLIGELEQAAAVIWAYWTRTTVGYPRYRVVPPRKYAWWFTNDYSDVALFFTGKVPAAPIYVSGNVVSGSTQQGTLLTPTAPVFDAEPAAAITYQWRRDGVSIAGATSASYTTQAADVGSAVSRRAIGTNVAGSAQVDSNAINVVAAGAPEITAHPASTTAIAGATATFSATCTATPTATFQWQRSTDAGATWGDVVGGTGGAGTGNSTSYTTPTLAGGDDGNRYRCVFTNVGGTSTTGSGTLSMVTDQGAARFTGVNGGELGFNIGGAGHADLVIEALMYFETGARQGNAVFLGLRHSGNGRAIQIRCNNTFEVYALGVGDTQTGHTAWATQPPNNTWVHVTLQAQTLADGDGLRATWTVAEGVETARYAATRTNGVESSVQGEVSFVGGIAGGNGSQGAVRVQYVRARTGYLADALVDSHRQDTSTAGWSFWWRFFDAGAGVLGVEDKTGNNRVPTLTGGTFATGPVVPGVP